MNKIDFDKQLICVAGMPRSGSTLMCQLFDHHPKIYCPGHSSPLPHTMNSMRSAWSNDSFLLSQLDVDFNLVYGRLLNAYRGLMSGWFAETDLSVVVDKNRGWLGMIEMLAQVAPNFHLIVMVRELSQLYGSIESQHQKTQLLDSGDKTASMSRYGRASAYFKNDGMVSRSLSAIQSAIEDIPEALKAHITYIKYERLVEAPQEVMKDIYARLELEPAKFNAKKLRTKPTESDSHYRYKFPHGTRKAISAPQIHAIPDRIRTSLLNQNEWYYKTFYPELLASSS